MHLRQRTKWLIFIASLLLSGASYAQNDTIRYVKSPYRAEYTPHFALGKFKRGFSNDSLKMSLDSLETKPRTMWSRHDSLQFAQISLKTGNKILSQYYYDHLKPDVDKEFDYWSDQLIIFYLNKAYLRASNFITKESPMILEFSKIYFFKQIFEAQIAQSKDDKWYKTHSVLNWETDSTLLDLERESPEFMEKVTYPLKNLESVLQKLISYVHEEDAIIASCCQEMGHQIEFYFNFTHAYLAYSLGRHYNKRDKDLLDDLKSVKAKMTERKYKIPNFRKYFPRIEYWRFEYKMLKEKVMFEKNDTTTYVTPNTMKPEKEPLITFPHQLIVIGGIFVFIVILSLILKPKK